MAYFSGGGFAIFSGGFAGAPVLRGAGVFLGGDLLFGVLEVRHVEIEGFGVDLYHSSGGVPVGWDGIRGGTAARG